MRTLKLAAVGLAAVAASILPLSSASAQSYGRGYGYGYGQYDRGVEREMRECRRELRRADSRREYRRELRECRREIARARYDDRRYRGYGYYDQYGRYHDSRYRSGYGWRDRW